MRSTGSTPGVLPLFVLLAFAAGLLLAEARPALKPSPTLIVLGAAQYNGHPSPAFRRRLDHALALYRGGAVRHIVVSGGVGTGDRFSEGAVGVKYLRAHGVPGGVLAAETRSRSTLQNLEFSRPLVKGPVTLVTDEVHATRALALARGLGLNATVSGVPLASTGEAARRYRAREKMLLVAYTLFGIAETDR